MNDTNTNHRAEHSGLTCVCRGRFSQLVRRVAGAPAGIIRAVDGKRRGSFLVLVVGVLALLSVIAVLYATVGNNDRQRSAAVLTADTLDQVPANVGDYISQIVADDVFSLQIEQTPAGRNVASRAAFDYPFTDWRSTSNRAVAGAARPLFNPTGDPRLDVRGNLVGVPQGARFQWVSSDPWLASTEPCFIDFAGNGSTLNSPGDYYRVRRDWLHISNVSPDGRYVNLALLRNNFGATSLDLSGVLTLPGPNGQPAMTQTDFGDPLALDTPAHFDSRQIGAFRPLVDGYAFSDPRHIANQWCDTDGDGFADARWTQLVDASSVLAGGAEVSMIPLDPNYKWIVAVRIIDASGLVNVNVATDEISGPIGNRPIGSSPVEVDLRALLCLQPMLDMAQSLPGGGAGPAGYDALITMPDLANATQDYRGYSADEALQIGHFAYQAARLSLASGVTVPQVDPLSGYNRANSTAFVGGNLGDPGVPANATTFAGNYNLQDVGPRQAWDYDFPLPGAPLTSSEARFRYWTQRRGAVQGSYLEQSTVLNQSGQVTTPGEIGNRGLFGEEDAVELFRYFGVNDPSTTSPFEVAAGGRDDFGGNQLLWYGPMRDNRALRAERPGFDQTQWDYFRLHQFVDVRHRLTPFSGAREIRSSYNVRPDHLDSFEARINPYAILASAATGTTVTPIDPTNANSHRVDLAANALFQGYSMALAPYLSEGNEDGQNRAWGQGNATYEAQGFKLSYGGQGAEFAVMTSAIMSVNMIDRFDTDSFPQIRTLLIDNDQRATLDPALYPWWFGSGGDLDLHNGDTRDSNQLITQSPQAMKLASSARNDNINSVAVNVVGVEAQPFITGSASFTVYTDAKSTLAGADDEPTITDEITIKGDITASNPDLLMRCVAFQLTNPFNVDITLGGKEMWAPRDPQTSTHEPPQPYPDLSAYDVADPDFPGFTRLKDYYYIEFGGRVYALWRLDDQRQSYTTAPSDGIDVVAKPITIKAGETIVVYALNRLPSKILERIGAADQSGQINNVGPNGIPFAKDPAQLKRIIRTHIAERNKGIGRSAPVGAEEDGIYWIPEIFSPQVLPTSAAQLNLVGKPGLSRSSGTTTSFRPWSIDEENSFGDLISGGSTPPENQTVRLWRALRTGLDYDDRGQYPVANATGERVTDASVTLPDAWNGGGTQPSRYTLYTHNDRSNDLLVDRLRLPEGTNFDLRLNGNYQVSGTEGGADGDNDNTNYTIALWQGVNRPADPKGEDSNGRGVRSGMLPAYCIERKVRGAIASGNNWNLRDQGPRPNSVNKNMFVQGAGQVAGASTSLVAWFASPGLGTDCIVKPVGVSPAYREDSGANGLRAASRANSNPVAANSDQRPTEKPNFEDDRPELILDNKGYIPLALNASNQVVVQGENTLRAIDMMTPLAVAPFQDPANSGAALGLNPADPGPGNWSTLTVQDLEWTTLSEAFCLALGYESAPEPDFPCAVRTMYPKVVAPGSSTLYKRLYDHAQLKLDDYVPFVDADGDGIFALNSTSNPPEITRGTQTPLAWNILDVFTVRPTSLDTLVPGTININTASEITARTVPMLSPPTLPDDPYLRHSGSAPRPAWWWGSTSPGSLTPKSDVAATICSVRDKIPVFFRAGSELNLPGQGINNQPYISFADSVPPFDRTQGYSLLDGHAYNTGIAGIREIPGLPTPGSLLMARMNLGDAESAASPSNIDHLGYDLAGANTGADSSRDGVSIGLCKVWTGNSNDHIGQETGWKLQPNVAVNDYQEKLAIVGGALGSVTTRSDVYVAWFVIQGYTKDDVSNLKDSDPMVPSVKRRFVMVIDRSNVRARGDKPKVLLMKELPVD